MANQRELDALLRGSPPASDSSAGVQQEEEAPRPGLDELLEELAQQESGAAPPAGRAESGQPAATSQPATPKEALAAPDEPPLPLGSRSDIKQKEEKAYEKRRGRILGQMKPYTPKPNPSMPSTGPGAATAHPQAPASGSSAAPIEPQPPPPAAADA